MKKQSVLFSKSTAPGGSWGESEISLGFGTAGTMCFLCKYFGQFPVWLAAGSGLCCGVPTHLSSSLFSELAVLGQTLLSHGSAKLRSSSHTVSPSSWSPSQLPGQIPFCQYLSQQQPALRDQICYQPATSPRWRPLISNTWSLRHSRQWSMVFPGHQECRGQTTALFSLAFQRQDSGPGLLGYLPAEHVGDFGSSVRRHAMAVCR